MGPLLVNAHLVPVILFNSSGLNRFNRLDHRRELDIDSIALSVDTADEADWTDEGGDPRSGTAAIWGGGQRSMQGTGL